MTDVTSLLDLCYRIEMTAAEVYRALARAHAAHPQLAALWSRTAGEEDNHALQFKLAPRTLEHMVAGAQVDEARARQALALVEDLLAEVRRGVASPAECLRTAIGFEDYLGQFHMNQAVSFTSDLYRKMFDAMMKADQAHVESLREALRELEG
jgi:rubrerythrin